MAKKKSTRPALVQPCESTEDHPKHHWRFPGAQWPEDVFWHCPGYDRAEMAESLRLTEKSIKKAFKKKGEKG